MDADFAGLEGLRGADDPLLWASANLALIGAGSAAYVFAHPLHEDRVVRVSGYPDGWFMYADETLRLLVEEATEVPFRPHVDWLADVSGYLVAVGERLDPVPEGSRMAEAVDLAVGTREGRSRWDDVETVCPGFGEFCRSLGPGLDLRPENFMRRGDTIVFNDPFASIPFGLEPILRDFYRIENNPAPHCGSAFGAG